MMQTYMYSQNSFLDRRHHVGRAGAGLARGSAADGPHVAAVPQGRVRGQRQRQLHARHRVAERALRGAAARARGRQLLLPGLHLRTVRAAAAHRWGRRRQRGAARTHAAQDPAEQERAAGRRLQRRGHRRLLGDVRGLPGGHGDALARRAGAGLPDGGRRVRVPRLVHAAAHGGLHEAACRDVPALHRRVVSWPDGGAVLRRGGGAHGEGVRSAADRGAHGGAAGGRQDRVSGRERRPGTGAAELRVLTDGGGATGTGARVHHAAVSARPLRHPVRAGRRVLVHLHRIPQLILVSLPHISLTRRRLWTIRH